MLRIEHIAAIIALLIEYDVIAFIRCAYVTPTYNVPGAIVTTNIPANIIRFQRANIDVYYIQMVFFSRDFFFCKQKHLNQLNESSKKIIVKL